MNCSDAGTWCIHSHPRRPSRHPLPPHTTPLCALLVSQWLRFLQLLLQALNVPNSIVTNGTLVRKENDDRIGFLAGEEAAAATRWQRAQRWEYVSWYSLQVLPSASSAHACL